MLLKPKLSYNLSSTFEKFYNKIINEKISEVKGTEKLSLRVLTFFINDFSLSSKLTEEEKIKKSGLYRILLSLVEKNDKVDSNIQSTFIEKMMQLTLSDTKLILPFIQFIDVISKKEVIISTRLNMAFAPVTEYLKSAIEKMGMGSIQKQENFFAKKLIIDIKNNLHQEAYTIFLLFTKLNINFSTDVVNKIYDIIQEKDVECDDFTLLFLVNRFKEYANNMSLKERNKFFDTINYLLSIRSYDDTISISEIFKDRVFIEKHWLLRYEILYLDKTDEEFHNMLNDYYKSHDIEVRVMDYSYFKKNYQGKHRQINRFYIDLLEEKVDFANFNNIKDDRNTSPLKL